MSQEWDELVVDSEDNEEVENVEITEEAVDETAEEKRVRAELRKQLVGDGYTKEDTDARRNDRRLDDEKFGDGSGYIKTAQFVDYMRNEHNVGVSVVVNAWGGDRAMYDPIDPRMTAYWYGRSRYLSTSCFEDDMIQKLVDIQAEKRASRKKKVEVPVEVPATPETGWTEESLKALKKAVLLDLLNETAGPDHPDFSTLKKAELITNILQFQS